MFNNKGLKINDIVLKILGYHPWSKKHDILSWIYTGFIFMIMLSPLILSIIRLIIFQEKLTISFLFYYLIGPVQYILGYRYIKTKHILSVLSDCKLNQYSLSPINKLITIIFTVATLGILTNIIILLATGDRPIEFEMILNKSQDNPHLSRLIYIWFITNWIVSSYILSLNISCFSFVFYKHLQDIGDLQEGLESEVIWKMDQTSFTNLSRKIVGLRYIIAQSVDKLESFFTTTTILGAISIGSVIEFKEVNAYLIYYFIVYFISQSVFLYFIYYISKNREDILKIIKSPSVIFKYLTNVKSAHNFSVLKREMIELQKLDPERVHTLNKYKIAAYSPLTFDQLIDMEEGSYQSDNSLEAELLTLSYKNNAAIDWIILQGILQEKWTSFNLLGISFDNHGVIKTFAGAITIIISASAFINSLNII